MQWALQSWVTLPEVSPPTVNACDIPWAVLNVIGEAIVWRRTDRVAVACGPAAAVPAVRGAARVDARLGRRRASANKRSVGVPTCKRLLHMRQPRKKRRAEHGVLPRLHRPGPAQQLITDVKGVVSTWRERLPNKWDDITVWTDLLSWRQHVFGAINQCT